GSGAHHESRSTTNLSSQKDSVFASIKGNPRVLLPTNSAEEANIQAYRRGGDDRQGAAAI
ncbi:MAG: hypothetical protein ACREYE_17405, partial [Gammaproteobacteria bacterium]